MKDLVIGKTNVTALLKGKYKKLGNGWVTLILAPASSHIEINMESIRLLKGMGYSGIYITLTKEYGELVRTFNKNKVSTSGVYFVDAVSKLHGEKRDSVDNCLFVSGPINIDSISSAVYDTIHQMATKKKFVFLDSLTAMQIYNNLPRTVRFSKFLSQTLKAQGVEGIMVSLTEGESNRKLYTEISKLCDEVIKIG